MTISEEGTIAFEWNRLALDVLLMFSGGQEAAFATRDAGEFYSGSITEFSLNDPIPMVLERLVKTV